MSSYNIKNQDRNKGIDLLKLIGCILIVFSHLFFYFFSSDNFINHLNWSIFSCLLGTVYGYGNAIFSSISGYFGVKFSITKILKIIFIATFYSIIMLFINILFFDFTYKDILTCIFPVFTNRFWYITSYVMLLIFSPCINFVIENKKIGIFLSMSLLFVYIITPTFLYYGMDGSYTWNFPVLLTYYVVVRYLLRYKIVEKIHNNYFIILFLFTFIFMVIFNIISTYLFGKRIPDTNVFTPFNRGNTLFMLTSVFSTIMIFKNINIKSKIITYLSNFTLEIYMIHSFILDKFCKSVDINFFPSSIFLKTIIMFIFGVSVFFISILIDIVRRKLFTGIEKKLIEKTVNFLTEKFNYFLSIFQVEEND